MRYARLHPAVCGAAGLFRSLPRQRGARDHPLVDVGWPADRPLASFSSDGLLGCDDMRILQAVVALEGSAGRHADDEETPFTILRAELHLWGTRCRHDVLAFETSADVLSRAAGYGMPRAEGDIVFPAGARARGAHGGGLDAVVTACLDRLHGVTLSELHEGKVVSSGRLLAWDRRGKGRRTLRLLLNPQLGAAADAKMAAEGEQRRYDRVNMAHARRLTSDPARLLHHRLSMLQDGGHLKCRMEVLVGFVWPETQALRGEAAAGPAPQALANRRATIRQAMAQLAALGWTFEEDEGNFFKVTRPGSRSKDAKKPNQSR